jgi:hypothetical protein
LVRLSFICSDVSVKGKLLFDASLGFSLAIGIIGHGCDGSLCNISNRKIIDIASTNIITTMKINILLVIIFLKTKKIFFQIFCIQSEVSITFF